MTFDDQLCLSVLQDNYMDSPMGEVVQVLKQKKFSLREFLSFFSGSQNFDWDTPEIKATLLYLLRKVDAGEKVSSDNVVDLLEDKYSIIVPKEEIEEFSKLMGRKSWAKK